MMATRVLHDALMKNQKFGSQAFTSRGLFPSSFMGTATSLAIASPFGYQSLFGNGPIAYCDAGVTLGEDHSAGMESGQFGSSYFDATLGEDHPKTTGFGKLFEIDEPKYNMKQYDIELKPLLSAFHWKTFGLTSLRSFLLFYLPLLEPGANVDDEDDDFLIENSEERPVDLVKPFYKSVKQIIRETSVATTRRILERVAVHYASQRIAWKLLKDVPKSAVRKAGRGLPTCTFCFRVSRTTLRGHLLGVVASWTVQVGINTYGFIYRVTQSKQDSDDETDAMEEVRILGKRVGGATVRCVSSLVFAAIGAGIGATLIRPSTGQWIGCALGDLAGPFIVEYCFGMLKLDI